jgi:hypothetical protein
MRHAGKWVGWQEPTVTDNLVSFSVQHHLRHLSSHAADHLPLCRPVLVRLAQGRDAPKITYDVLCLAKVHLLQQVAHLQLHVLNHLADVGDVRCVILNSHISLHLADHVTRQVQTAERFGVGAEREDDRRGQLVVSGASAVCRVEHVDAVPAARAALCRVDGWRSQFRNVRAAGEKDCIPFFSSTQPAKPSSMSQRYTLDMPPS